MIRESGEQQADHVCMNDIKNSIIMYAMYDNPGIHDYIIEYIHYYIILYIHDDIIQPCMLVKSCMRHTEQGSIWPVAAYVEVQAHMIGASSGPEVIPDQAGG